MTAGEKLGHYEIIAPLGAGGMGEVYRARDPRLNREVAIKLLPEKGDKARFQTEARALAALNHPNIVAIFDVGDNYLVTELVDGALMKATGVRQAIDFAAQAADGLSAAHSVGIYHRDIKPQNVLVTPEGRVKLIDFGLAKDAAHSDGAQTLTADGTVMGTAPYMSPEQVRGQKLDARSDLFSLGAVLYEQLSGKRPFQGETVAVTMSAVLNEEPEDLPEKVPGGLKQIVYRCLAKDKAARFQNAADLSFALRALGSGSSTGHMQSMVAAPPVSKTSKLGWIAAAVMTVTACVALWAPWRKPPEPARPVRFTVEPPKNMKFGDLNFMGPPLLSPDGSMLLIPAEGEGRRRSLWVRPLDSLEARKLEGTEGAEYPFWSPDSRQVAFFTGGKLVRAPIDGSGVLPVCEARSGRGGAWAPAGSAAEDGGLGVIIFSPSNYEDLHQVPAAGGAPKPVTKLDRSKGERSHRFPLFLPGGRHFLYLVLDNERAGSPVMLASLDGGAAKLLFRSDSRVSYAPPQAGEPAGHLLFVRGNVLLAQRFNARSLSLEGDPVAIQSGVGVTALRQMPEFSVSESGVLAFKTGGGTRAGRLGWLSANGAVLKMLPGMESQRFRSSPDGKRAAFARANGARIDQWVADLERETTSPVTSSGVAYGTPVWSSDGKRLAYASQPGADTAIMATTVDAGDEVQRIATIANTPAGFLSDWSPDGRYILLSYQPGVSVDIFAVRVEDGKILPVLATEANERDAVLSPDGKWLAYESNESGPFEIYVRPFVVEDGVPKVGSGKWMISRGGGVNDRWSKTGRELYYLADGRLMAVTVRPGATFAFDPPKELFKTTALGFDPAPDGRFLALLPQENEAEQPLTVVLNWQKAMLK